MSVSKPKNSKYYITRFTFTDKKTGFSTRVQRSTGETTKEGAQRYENQLRAELREQYIYGNQPKKTWLDAEKRWLTEQGHKRTILQDVEKFEFLQQHLGNLQLEQITKDVIERIAEIKESEGRTPATINRLLALIKSVLNKAYKQWEWIDKVPYIRMRKEDNNRIRWITKNQANDLVAVLPTHLSQIVKFALATGLRHSNIVNLKWSDIHNNLLVISGDDFKNGNNFSIPLNTEALEVLEQLKGQHEIYVFTFKGQRIRSANTKAFRKALLKVEIQDFRFHDLRHTWASWHVQNGTSLQELQALGGWQSFDMVLRYSHLNKENLREAANKIAELV